MSRKLCKGIRKDGSPCQGHGLDQYDGYCIAHAPADLTHEWRSRGGKNSATAARLDKRIPERLKDMLELLDSGMKQVTDGTLSPARYAAICRGVKLKLDIYRQADKDMDLIRSEEIQAAAAQHVGVRADLDILDAADAINAKQDQYRSEALVDQGFAEVKEQFNRDDPPEIFLNDTGRRRFGYHSLAYTQQLLNEVEDELTDYDPYQSDLSEITGLLEDLQEDVEDTLSGLARDDAPFDPLTGQSITDLPTGVQTRSKLDRLTLDEVKPQERLQEQLAKIKMLMRKAEEFSQAKEVSQAKELFQAKELSQTEEPSQNEDDEHKPGEAADDEEQEQGEVRHNYYEELTEEEHNRNTLEFLKKIAKGRRSSSRIPATSPALGIRL